MKDELRDRAERESRELRDALDAERARLYQDLETERRARAASPPGAEDAGERVRRLRAESGERREDIEREVRGYLSAESKPVESPPPAAQAATPLVPAPTAAVPPRDAGSLRVGSRGRRGMN